MGHTFLIGKIVAAGPIARDGPPASGARVRRSRSPEPGSTVRLIEQVAARSPKVPPELGRCDLRSERITTQEALSVLPVARTIDRFDEAFDHDRLISNAPG